MTMADVATVAAIEAEATAFPWSATLFEDCIRAGHRCQVYIADNEQIIAYSVVQLILDEAHLLNICVAPSWQEQGYGRKVLRTVIKFAENNKCAMILLEVRESNHRAQSLYQRLGFNEMSVRQGYYPAETGRENAVLMALMLF